MRYIFIIFVTSLTSCVFTGSAYTRGQWKTHPSAHFMLYYKLAPVQFVAATTERAEQHFGKICRDLGLGAYPQWWAAKRVRIYIYNDKADYQSENKDFDHTQWSAGFADLQDKKIVTYPLHRGSFLIMSCLMSLPILFFVSS